MRPPGRRSPLPDAVAEALWRARDFVSAHGSPSQRLRLAALLGETGPEPLLALVEARQTPEGAVAPLDGEAPAGAGSTEAALAVLAAVGLLHRPCAERAAAWLAGQQRPDGSFAADAGPQPDALAFTARVAGRLAQMGCVPLRVLEAAAERVARDFCVERIQTGGWQVLAAYAALFANHPHERADAALQWCGRELERGFRSGRFDAIRTARVFCLCDAQALPGARVSAKELVEAMLVGQARDGGFGESAAGLHERLALTLDAAEALLRLASD